MTWQRITTGPDHLKQFTRKRAIDAVSELVWNALDADADNVDVDIDTVGLGEGGDILAVSTIRVSDDGHGFNTAESREAFLSFGDSWKIKLNGVTATKRRPLHGRHGRGRFYAYSLGPRVEWKSVYEDATGRWIVEFSGNASTIDGFECSQPKASGDDCGTVVTIDADQEKKLGSLLSDDFQTVLATRLAPHLLGNPEVTVRAGGIEINPRSLLDREPEEHELNDLDTKDLQGFASPSLLIVEWNASVRNVPGLLLCGKNGAAFVEIPDWTASPNLKVTGYLKWEGFEDPELDHTLAHMKHAAIVSAGQKRLREYVIARSKEFSGLVVEQMKKDGTYPYKTEPTHPLERAEREVFDVVAAIAHDGITSSSRKHRAMSAKLLQLALQERPESLDRILAETLRLTEEERRALVDLLEQMSFASLINGATEVTRRLELLIALRHLLYDSVDSKEFREVDQLHPLIKENVWVFGEAWKLSRSEAGLASVIRDVLKGTSTILEEDLLKQSKDERGRVDLLLNRVIRLPRGLQRLVVELKRPSTKVGQQELEQVKRYARVLSKHSGAGDSIWEFWLVAAQIDDEIHDEVNQDNREKGVVIQAADYDVRVVLWSDLINENETRYEFFREQLGLEISGADALKKLHEIHSKLLPVTSDTAA